VPYFTWKEKGLTEDCASLNAMAARLQEAAQLLRRMADEGFQVERLDGLQRITHHDPDLFKAYGFVSEEAPERQLGLVLDPASDSNN
jgi:hypothetical protein